MSQPFSSTTEQMAVPALKSANTQIFRALLSIASAALLIRIMGMFNQIIVTNHFGEGAAIDAYIVASTLPLLLAQLINGTIEIAVIPVYTRIRTRGQKEEASRLFSTLLNLLLLGSIALTLCMLLFHTVIIHLVAPALDPLRTGIASSLTLFIYPVLLLMVVIGFLESILNAEGQFGWPAYAGLLVPLVTALLVLTLGKSQGVVTLCIGMLLGLLLQLGIFILRVRQAGINYRPVLELRNPVLRTVLIVAWPALLGAFISQISPLIDQVFASFLSIGSISALSYALKLIGVLTGVIFASVGRATLPYLSRHAGINDFKSFKKTLHLYIWGVGMGTAVLSILIVALAHPLVQILFQRGAFSATDTDRTAITLVGFAIGLVPMAFIFILTQSFSALGKTRILMLMGIYNVITNAIFDLIFAHFWQSEGIALATSTMYFGGMFIEFALLRQILGPLHMFTPPAEVKNMLKKLFHLHRSRQLRFRISGEEKIIMEDHLRICFVSFMFSPIIGGAEVRTEKQARQLQSLGHDVTILTLQYHKQWKQAEELAGLPVVRVGGLFRRDGQLRVGRLGHIPLDINMFFLLWRMRHTYDIIHVFQISPLAAVAALIGKLTHTPVVISSQCAMTDKEQQRYAQQDVTLMNDTLPMMDFMKVDRRHLITSDIAVLPRTALGGKAMLNFLRTSEAYFQALSTRSKINLSEQGFRADHIVHIPGSVHIEKFRPADVRQYDQVRLERDIICVARLEYSKGIDVLLHAWAQFIHTPTPEYSHLKPRLRIVGSGILLPQLKHIATALDILDTVEFLGLRTDIPSLLQQSWGFVLPSRWEGMPNALLEGMACGLPCIATQVSGSEDIITSGLNGILVKPEQPAEIALALRHIIEDTHLAQQLGNAARTTVVCDYQLSNIVNQCLALYKQLIKQQHQKGKAHEQSTHIHRYPNVSSPSWRSGETGTDARS